MWLCPVCASGSTAARKEGNGMIKRQWEGKERMSRDVWTRERLLSVGVWSFVCSSRSGRSKSVALERGKTVWRDFPGVNLVSGLFTPHSSSSPSHFGLYEILFRARTQRDNLWWCGKVSRSVGRVDTIAINCHNVTILSRNFVLLKVYLVWSAEGSRLLRYGTGKVVTVLECHSVRTCWETYSAKDTDICAICGFCEFWGSDSDVAEDSSLLECYILSAGKYS